MTEGQKISESRDRLKSGEEQKESQDRLKNGEEQKESRKRFWTEPAVVFLAALICCFLWGSASPAIKIGYVLFNVPRGDLASRILFAGVRFTIAGLMVIVFDSIRRKKISVPQRQSWKYVLALMSFQTILQYVFFYTALAHTSGVRGSVINAAGNFFSIIFSVFIFHYEKLTVRKTLGSLLGFLGVVLISTGGKISGMPFTLAGDGAMILATLSSAMAANLIKKFSAHEDPVVLSGWQFFLGGLVMAFGGFAAGGRISPSGPEAVILILYMGFISAGAYTLWSILLKYNEVSRIVILGFMNPVLGVLLSAAFLDERSEAFSLLTLISLILVSAGIVISAGKRRRADAAPEKAVKR